MRLVSVELKPQPMVYVSAHSSMADIQAVMGTAFETLGDFVGAAHIAPQGPPLAIYHDWSEGKTMVDIGFPVSAADSNKAIGKIHAGMTPAGFALKTLHQGSYAGFAHTYAAIDKAMKDAKIPDSKLMWETYLSEPETTPEPNLVTEIYTQVSAEDAAKFPRG